MQVDHHFFNSLFKIEGGGKFVGRIKEHLPNDTISPGIAFFVHFRFDIHEMTYFIGKK